MDNSKAQWKPNLSQSAGIRMQRQPERIVALDAATSMNAQTAAKNSWWKFLTNMNSTETKTELPQEWLVKFANLAGISEIEFINAPNGGWFGSDAEGNSINVTWEEVFKRLEEDSGIRAFQDEVRSRVIDLSGAPDSAIDGGGSDGDWIEFTFAEIGQGFAWLREQNDTLRKRLEAVEKERDDFHQWLLNREESLKRSGEDWVKAKEETDRVKLELAKAEKANGELVKLIQRAMLNTRNDAILLGRLGLGDPEHVKETQWWKDAEKATAEALKGEG